MNLSAKRKQNIWLLAAVGLAFCVVCYMLTPLVMRPGHILLESTGDGGKNYFTYLYHILWEKGIWSHSLNYPYGDHVIYSDNQPILSVPLSYLKDIVPINMTTALVIMHLSIVVSYVLGIVFVYKILIASEVKPYLALVFAPLVIIMSPQVSRINGHFALCHVFFIPAMLYFLLRYYMTGLRKYAVYIFIVTTLMAFMHPYYGGLAFVMVMLYILAYCLFTRFAWKQRVKNVLPLFGSIIACLALIELVILFTDPLKDRPLMPRGILEFITENPDFLTSFYSPISHILYNKGWSLHMNKFSEGFSYIGIVAIIVLAISLVAWYISLLRGLIRSGKPEERERVISTKIWLFIAFVTLILAKGMPFKWNMLWLLDYLSVFKQFRALGRFSWVFYYICTIYAIVFVCRYYNVLLQRKRMLAYVFILLPLATWSYEASGYLKLIKEKAGGYYWQYDWYFFTDAKNWSDFLAEHQHTSKDFQALLVLPYTNFGTEKLWVNQGYSWNIATGYRAAIGLQLPMIDANTSRLSWSQAEQQVRIAGGPWADKPMLRDLKDERPFLLMKYDAAPLSPEQEYLLSASDSIGHFDQFYLYACYPGRIRKNDSLQYASIKDVYANMPNGDTCLQCNSTWYLAHFDKQGGDDDLYGSGSQLGIPDSIRAVADINITDADTGREYEVSCWVLLARDNYKSPDLYYESVDSRDSIISKGLISVKESTDNDGGLWFRAGSYFKMPAGCKKLRIILVDEEPPSYRRIDELMLRPVGATIISRSASRAMVDNHIYKPPVAKK